MQWIKAFEDREYTVWFHRDWLKKKEKEIHNWEEHAKYYLAEFLKGGIQHPEIVINYGEIPQAGRDVDVLPKDRAKSVAPPPGHTYVIGADHSAKSDFDRYFLPTARSRSDLNRIAKAIGYDIIYQSDLNFEYSHQFEQYCSYVLELERINFVTNWMKKCQKSMLEIMTNKHKPEKKDDKSE